MPRIEPRFQAHTLFQYMSPSIGVRTRVTAVRLAHEGMEKCKDSAKYAKSEPTPEAQTKE